MHGSFLKVSEWAPRSQGWCKMTWCASDSQGEVSHVTGDDGSWAPLAGPSVLGRSVLVSTGDVPPAPWAQCKRIRLSKASLSDAATLRAVRHAYLTRTPVIYELDGDAQKPSPGVDVREPWRVAPNADFKEEAIWRLATLNSVDARDRAHPTWQWSTIAMRAGATPASGDGDVIGADGLALWCDGGPVSIWGEAEQGLRGIPVVPRTSIAKGLLTPSVAHSIEAELAPDQLAAVADHSTRARIIAPAGSGKTRVLTERARHLYRSGIPAESLLLLAYNTRAQQEMRNRTTDMPDLQIQTLNAVGLAIINGRHGFCQREDTRTTIEEGRVRAILQSLHDFPRVRDSDPVADWITALTEVRLGLRAPAHVEASYGGDLEGFAELFPRYRRYLADNGLVDFDEQIYLAIEVMLREWPVRFHAEKLAEVLLVDEFQDFRPADMLLLRLLAGPTLSVFAVGDDDQTIYGYSGATPEWLVGFEEHVPAAAHHALEVNYRCPAPVVQAASNLVSHNRLRVAKAIRPGPNNTTARSSLRIRKGQDQVTFTVGCVRELLEAGAVPSDVAILTRVNVLLFPLLVALLEAGVPVRFLDTDKFLSGSGVTSVLAWLRVGLNPQVLSSADIVAAARRPNRNMSPKVLEMVGEQTSLAGLERLAKRLDGRTSKQIEELARDVERLARHLERGTSASAIKFVLEQLGLDQSLVKLDHSREGKDKASTFDSMRALIALGQQHPDATSFETWMRESLAASHDAKGVELSTVHKVKGQEWPHVIVYDASQGIFPHRLSADLEEERRVFHVAITRCVQSLIIVADADEPSEYLPELSSAFVPRAPAPTRAPQPRPLPKPQKSARPPRKASDSRRQQRAGSHQNAPARVKRSSHRPANDGPKQGDAIVASVGLRFRWSGYDCTVSALNSRGAEVSFGATRLTVSFGERVQVAGQYRILSRGS